jgi:CheY-like chemotaxis protein
LFVDEPVNLKINRRILLKLGVSPDNITFTTNGKELLEYMRDPANKPHVLFTDLYMPIYHGFEVIRMVGKRPYPVVIASAVCDIETRQESVALGCAGFLGKPYTLEKVRVVLSSLIRISEWSDAVSASSTSIYHDCEFVSL